MKLRNQRKKKRPSRRSLKIEQLEARELLAADLMPPLMPPHAGFAESTAEFASTSAEGSGSQSTSAVLESVVIPVAASGEVRSVDGTGNNLTDTDLGSTNEQLLRVSEAAYSDGISTPAGDDRPSAREISNALAAQDGDTVNDRQLSSFIFAWGQFIDHDIDLTSPDENGAAFNIEVPAGDPLFDPENTGTQVITLTRSLFDETTGTGVDDPREQISEISSWIDASQVYGSDQATADSLRSFEGGKLQTSDGDLPPVDANGNFIAGDVLANENVGLTAIHTLFIREHNWWAEQIAEQDPSLSDEEIYQQTRSIVIAEIQAITFNEFLPALLGADAIETYEGYDSTVNPSIANEFSTAAFRLHTLINDGVEFFGNDGRAMADEVPLAEAFFNPDLLRETGADSILKYFASSQSQEFDLQVVDSLRNFLFGQPGQGGFDLASLNIQRGRDHGLADYNAVREAYGLDPVESFDEISSDPEIQQTLETLYGSVDDIDLWVGALAEDRLPGSSVGELVQTIVADQFQRLRDGDRFWYENIFTGESLAQIESTSLADVIARNTTIENLQENVFFMQAEVTGQVFVDNNGNGRQDRREEGVRGITVELLDDEGTVIDTTLTDVRGRYQFENFRETGDYQIRIAVPGRLGETTNRTMDVLISRGGETVSGVDFALDSQRKSRRDRPHDRNRTSPPDQFAAIDDVFANLADNELLSPVDLEAPRTSRGGGRG